MEVIVSAIPMTLLAKPAVPRSPKWAALEASWLRSHPTCMATGRSDCLIVHHKLPFHEFPELELDPDNLWTMTEHPSFNAHLWIGHRGDFKDYNPRVEEYSEITLDMLKGARDAMKKETWKISMLAMVRSFYSWKR